MNAAPEAFDDDPRAQLQIADSHQGLRIDQSRGLEGWRSCDGHENSNFQAPSSRQTPNFKLQKQSVAAIATTDEFWDLAFGACLEPDAWRLEFPFPAVMFTAAAA